MRRKILFLSIPFYNEETKEFKESLSRQTVKYIKIVRRDTKKDKIYWSRACNDFYKDAQNYLDVKSDDVICIMCNDISFPDDFLEQGGRVNQGEIFIPANQGVLAYWKDKKFLMPTPFPNCFSGRCFFMTYIDFIRSGGFTKWLPHYLSDYDFALRQIKRGLKPVLMDSRIGHNDHPKESKVFSVLSPANPVFWTIFLLRHLNKYTPINILKSWYDGIKYIVKNIKSNKW